MIESAAVATDKKLCFVIGPIGDEGDERRIHADWLLEGIIEPVMAEFHGFVVKRADHDPRPGLIDAQMINDLLNADLVIADLSFSNPNAFYEIGIRHMAQRPIIHMQLATEKPPFDVSLYRAIKFSRLKFRDIGIARGELKRAVEAVLAKDYTVENPVTNARGRFRLEEHATPEIQVLLEQMRAMQGRLDRMERPSPALFETWLNRNRTAHRDIKPGIFYGGGDAIPTETTLLSFMTVAGLTDTDVGEIQKLLAERFGLATMVSRTPTELIVAVPGEVKLSDIKLPANLGGIDVTPVRAMKDPGHY
jgi:hypothetical protein